MEPLNPSLAALPHYRNTQTQKLRIRVERGLFMPPTRLKLIDFPLTGHDVCGQ